MTLVKDVSLHKALLKFEQSQLLSSFKFAVLYAGKHSWLIILYLPFYTAPGQASESEFYGNTKHSSDFEEFLNFLGERIELKGWTGFRAGLDVRSGTTGSHSVFTKFMELNIMFHVSTFLPYTPGDSQQVRNQQTLKKKEPYFYSFLSAGGT